MLVGREAELAQLHHWLDKALDGERQIVFVTGEPGIGKTTLVDTFLSSVQSPASYPITSRSSLFAPRSVLPALWLGRGQCIEHYGAGEAYLPILEALGRLCRGSEGARLVALLNQHAPTWLVQMPALFNDTELEALQRKTAGATRERMLRELAEALEVITAERPVILWLEDLHWSDVSTLDLLSMLARRQEPARLLVIGTYRPVEVLTHEHPLKAVKQELQLHNHCQELALDFLSEAAVGEYLAVRFSVGATHASPLQSLAHGIHRRTDGNPLFMVNVVDHLLSQEVLVQTDGQLMLKNEDLATTVPESLRQLIEQQITRISPDERKILEAASVAGAEFSAAAVAAGTEQSPEGVETHCDGLVHREQFLRARETSEWPDGTSAARYGFVHALYQEVLYEQISASRRIRLHRQIGERGEQAYGERVREIAVELAVHFEQGRDYERAVHYLHQAGENAIRRSAHQEAITHLTKGLALLTTLPDTPERDRLELTLQLALGASLIAIKGFAALEVEQVYARARNLCQQVEEIHQPVSVLVGLCAFYMERAELDTGQELAEQLLHLAKSKQDPFFLLWAHLGLGELSFFLGEFALACVHLEQSFSLYDPQQHDAYGFAYDPGVYSLSRSALILYLLGYPDHALRQGLEALTLARKLAHPYSLVCALDYTAEIHRKRGEQQADQELEKARVALCTEQGFTLELAYGTIFRGWTLAMQGQEEEGIEQIRQGLAAFRATGSELGRPNILSMLAEAYGKAGQGEAGLTALAEALALINKNGERWYEAELYRLKGELTLQQFNVQGSKFKVENPQSAFHNPHSEAEACFHKAIEVARQQQAKSWELRATTSLVRLWQQQGKKKQAHKMLAEIYNWFTEGFDTKDLQEAKALLDSLGSRVQES